MAVTLGLVLVLGAAACTRSEPTVDPAQARKERVEARLRSTFTDTQARCILTKVDTSVLRALDTKKALPADSAELTEFSAALRTCVEGGAGPSTTSASTPRPTTTG